MTTSTTGWLAASAVTFVLVSTSCSSPYDRRLLGPRLSEMRSPRIRSQVRGAEPSIANPDVVEVPAEAEVRQCADLSLYLRYALHNNAGLRASYERFFAGVERVAQAGVLPDPQLTFAQFIEDVQTRTGPQQRRYSLTQGFPWFGKLGLSRDVARGRAEELWFEVVQTHLEVERDVAVQFAEYAYLSHVIRITRDVLDLLQQLEPVLQERVTAGRSTRADLLRLQVEIGRIENDLRSRERVRPSLSARLAAAMNWKGSAPLPLPELEEPELAAVDSVALVQQAISSNPRLRQLAERAKTARDRLRLAELGRWPDFQIGVDYFETDDALVATPGSGDDPWALRIGFNLPFGSGRYAAQEREAGRLVAAAIADLENQRARLRAEIEAVAFSLEDAGRQVVLYRETLLTRSREALEVTRSAYTAGSATLLEVIDSERVLLQFEVAYWRACRDHYQSRARLEALIGGER